MFLIAFLLSSMSLLLTSATLCLDLETKKIKFVTVSIVSPSICHEVMGLDAIIFIVWMLSFKPAFHTALSPSSRRSLVPLCSLPLCWYYLHIWGCYVSPGSLDSSFWLMQINTVHDVLNKQGDNIQPWCTPFPLLNQFFVPCLVLIVVSWLAYRFLRRQVKWSGIPISLTIFHSLLWSTQSKLLA